MGNKRVLVLLEIAIFAALAFVLDFIAFSMPQGGSVSLAMIPVVLMAFRRGVWAGIGTGALFGLLQLILGRYYAAPLSFGFVVLQLFLEYIAAFAVVGLAGITRSPYLKKLHDRKFFAAGLLVAAGVFVASFLRYLIHTAVGVWFFSSFAEGNVLIYSVTYNATYMVPIFLLTALVCWGLFTAAPRLTDPEN
ncbi:energy-coupled thiamine transporter ThiT [Indiicoccus explosivorum]|uniref:energy-coupled thiamine transporter ThiT n=1 Tax=Indiicoccus explosivorum TaxID=1917864 RepID=UPI000B42F6B3|nr:energy-coupled thiamine transporter ThiT [Indiicoccus explosivorum]